VPREGWPVSAVAMAFGMSERAVYKWLARFRAEGLAGLAIGARLPIAAHMPWRRRGLALIRLLRQQGLIDGVGAVYLPYALATASISNCVPGSARSNASRCGRRTCAPLRITTTGGRRTVRDAETPWSGIRASTARQASARRRRSRSRRLRQRPCARASSGVFLPACASSRALSAASGS